MKEHPGLSRFVLGFVKVTGLPAAALYLRPKVYYENREAQGKRLPSPCILMSNHKSLLDFVLYLTVFPFRTIRFLMAEVLYNKGKQFSRFLYHIGGIRVDRDGFDFGFVGETLEILDRGGTVGVFPEGRLPIKGVPFPFKPSIVFIALRTDAPIVPIYTDGRYGFKSRAHIIIGERINIHDYCREEKPTEEEIERLTRLLEDKTAELGRELERRIAAENDN